MLCKSFETGLVARFPSKHIIYLQKIFASKLGQLSIVPVKEKSDTPDNLKLPCEQSTALCAPAMSIQHVTKHEYLISNAYLKAGRLQDFPKTLCVLYYKEKWNLRSSKHRCVYEEMTHLPGAPGSFHFMAINFPSLVHILSNYPAFVYTTSLKQDGKF